MTVAEFITKSQLHSKLTAFQWKHINDTHVGEVFDANGRVYDVLDEELKLYVKNDYRIVAHFDKKFHEQLMKVKKETPLKIRFKLSEVSQDGSYVYLKGDLTEIL